MRADQKLAAMIRIAADLTGQAQLSPQPLAVGKVHGQQSLEGR
jgi:hypothetical protein